MKRVLRSLDAACVAAVVILVGTNAVGASDRQTLNTAGNGPSLLAQEAGPKEAKASTTAKVNVDSQGMILKGYDAVAYFKQEKPVKGNPEIKSSYQGATYLFASAEDKADFDKDPAKHVPQYGGFCAYGVVNGVLFDSEEDAFIVYKGKLYLSGNQEGLKIFKDDIDSNIDKADNNWRRITGN